MLLSKSIGKLIPDSGNRWWYVGGASRQPTGCWTEWVVALHLGSFNTETLVSLFWRKNAVPFHLNTQKRRCESTISSNHWIGRKVNVRKQGEELHSPRETWPVSTQLGGQRATADGLPLTGSFSTVQTDKANHYIQYLWVHVPHCALITCHFSPLGVWGIFKALEKDKNIPAIITSTTYTRPRIRTVFCQVFITEELLYCHHLEGSGHMSCVWIYINVCFLKEMNFNSLLMSGMTKSTEVKANFS